MTIPKLPKTPKTNFRNGRTQEISMVPGQTGIVPEHSEVRKGGHYPQTGKIASEFRNALMKTVKPP